MSTIIQFVADRYILFVAGILIFFGLVETLFGYLHNSKRTKDDILVETLNTFFLFVITKPLVVLATVQALTWLFPNQQNALSILPFWAGLCLFLLVDDFLQYWYHRFAHEYKWLWKGHRAHHTATEMGLLVSYREAVWYFVFMPNVWWLGVFTYLGGIVPMAIGIVLKQVIIISSHSLATWDSFFYKRPILMPIIKVLERIFVTPAFHHGHHAVSIIDGIGNPNGNFGNMFSIWDQLFGTAKFTHAFPTAYGIPNDPKDNWQSAVFYPLITSDKPHSELAADFVFDKTTLYEPAVLTLKEGDYLYCACGYSKTQPFCDGSHHGTKFQPVKFTILKQRTYRICQCKGCAKAPFCDDTHIQLAQLKKR
jgi:sterol desaturase/sphingolipid hydroxylase (fatty acid hydroxylase superfamily)/CDGSH-type Zn-finger protein